MELYNSGTHRPSAACPALHDSAHAGYEPLGLEDLVFSGPTLRCADAPITLTGLRLHCHGTPAPETTAQQSAAERLLISLAQGLCAPFWSHDDYVLELNEIEASVAAVNSPAWVAANHLVQYDRGLCDPGASGTVAEALADERLERAGQGSTVVALAPQRGVPQVLGTLRFTVGERLGVLDFFAPEPTTGWPHGYGKSAECTRVAFHPVLDRMARAAGALQRELTRFYKVLVLRKLVSRCTEEILDTGAQSIHVIAAPNVVRFSSAGGLRLEPLSEALAGESDLSRPGCETLPRYWPLEHSRQETIAYVLSAELDEITLPIGRHRIVIAPDNSLRVTAVDDAHFAPAAA